MCSNNEMLKLFKSRKLEALDLVKDQQEKISNLENQIYKNKLILIGSEYIDDESLEIEHKVCEQEKLLKIAKIELKKITDTFGL